jgi:UDP-4-amino-4,6-dideoxy-N-acetyl-beta-L-altrosamine transaminase
MNIPYGRQDINKDDINAVINVLTSDNLTQGSMVPEFESAVSEYCGVNFAIATNSATSALHLACLALGVGDSDHVWTTPISFVASANCALYCGANVDFVDIDPCTYNISVDALTSKLKYAKSNNSLPKVLIPVHMTGQCCDMKAIHSLSIEYGFKIIEDASHAIGAKYLEMPVGNCHYSDITIFSFHPVKIITTGEGGMALTNDVELSGAIRRLRSHGITRDSLEMDAPADGPWYYQQIDLGFNYRMTDFQAAMGLSQLNRLDCFINKRHKIASIYDKLLEDLPIIRPWKDPNCYSSNHLYIIRVPEGSQLFNRKQIFERLRSNGIGVNVHYIPIYRQPYYRKFGYRYEDFPESEAYYSEAISLPIFPLLTSKQQSFVVEVLSSPIGHQSLF